jgi:hypothetical protein
MNNMETYETELLSLTPTNRITRKLSLWRGGGAIYVVWQVGFEVTLLTLNSELENLNYHTTYIGHTASIWVP